MADPLEDPLDFPLVDPSTVPSLKEAHPIVAKTYEAKMENGEPPFGTVIPGLPQNTSSIDAIMDWLKQHLRRGPISKLADAKEACAEVLDNIQNTEETTIGKLLLGVARRNRGGRGNPASLCYKDNKVALASALRYDHTELRHLDNSIRGSLLDGLRIWPGASDSTLYEVEDGNPDLILIGSDPPQLATTLKKAVYLVAAVMDAHEVVDSIDKFDPEDPNKTNVKAAIDDTIYHLRTLYGFTFQASWFHPLLDLWFPRRHRRRRSRSDSPAAVADPLLEVLGAEPGEDLVEDSSSRRPAQADPEVVLDATKQLRVDTENLRAEETIDRILDALEDRQALCARMLDQNDRIMEQNDRDMGQLQLLLESLTKEGKTVDGAAAVDPRVATAELLIAEAIRIALRGLAVGERMLEHVVGVSERIIGVAEDSTAAAHRLLDHAGVPERRARPTHRRAESARERALAVSDDDDTDEDYDDGERAPAVRRRRRRANDRR
ncbi:expressed unknown protein [Seminavis robusta]|uniref:Uncharacterized protein n=1 Tax=Seminavis robusta TaxID=568900 RepID=A0A9N8EWV2_9STRA|nr:expressed unknown protein [Seminavis robusta]|eukprot:Sro2570_g331550.1 n/a (492) ;mRNA; r:6330-8080